MSLGYSVGDIMAISRLAVKVYTAYKDAPNDYRHIANEVKSLHIIINNAAQHFESTTLSGNKQQEGKEVLQGCQDVLKDLDSLILKYNSLASASTSQVVQRIKLGIEDIAALRIRLISNTTLLNGFIQSCDSDKIQARLDKVLGLHRTVSKDSIVSFAGSVNTKKAYKKFCKGLFDIGVTADMISQKEKEIQDIFQPHRPPTTSNHANDGTFMDQSQLPAAGSSSGTEASPTSTPTISPGKEPKSRSGRFGWARPPIDFLVGPLMLSAAEAGNTKRLVSALGYVRNIDFVDDKKETALHKAAENGHNDIVQLLLSKGASIEAMDCDNSTPLHYAALNGHTNIVELLLSKGALIEAMNVDNHTPLHWAAHRGHINTVELLLSKGALIEAMDDEQDTPLHRAALNGHTSTVGLLLSKGALIEAMDDDQDTPLHLAALNGHTSIVGLLLSKGASIEALNSSNTTPLDIATAKGHLDTAKLLRNKAAELVIPGSVRSLSG